MEKIYFAHPTCTYNEPIEDSFERLIAHHLTNGDRSLIENPNQPHHQVGYEKYAKRLKESGTDHKGMSYFYDEVLSNCLGCAGVSFLDGRLGLGVAGEMKKCLLDNKPVWIVRPVHQPCLSQDLEAFISSPFCGLFSVNLLLSSEVELLVVDDPRLVVPHQETRLRSWRVYNRVVRPYGEAHLVSMPIPDGFYPEG